jgi:hypothetical protein
MAMESDPSAPNRAPKPLISVILNFCDPRGHPEHIKTWTEGQTLPGEQFEVVVITTAMWSRRADDLRAHLRPQDTLICTDSNQPFHLYDLAVASTRGKLLFISEDHCIARAGCLESVARFMENGEFSAASVRFGHISRNDFARAEERLCRRDEQTWLEEDHWNKIRIRGVVVTRAAYDAAGGIDGTYDSFSEAVLSARLHAAGHRMGLIPEEGVQHLNTSYFGMLYENIWQYVWNECRFCDERDPEFCERYFNGSFEFLRRERDAREHAGWLRTAIWRVWWREMAGPDRREAIDKLLGVAWDAMTDAIFGRFRLRLTARWSWLMARARFALSHSSDERLYLAFVDAYDRNIDITRASYLASHPCTPKRVSNAPALPGVDVPALRAFGSYSPEAYQGRTFCWMRPEALLWFSLPPGDYQVTLDTGGIRYDLLGLFWNEQLIPREEIDCRDDRMTFRVSRDAFVAEPLQRLTVLTRPVGSPEDPRRLGLSLFGIDFSPIEGELEDRCALPRRAA